MNRRQFIKKSLAFGAGCYLLPLGCSSFKANDKRKVIVLGIDGMDPHLTRVYTQQGLMPNLRRLVQKGSMLSVASSEPPQSPVAWSNFSVGASPAVHGIYDFIHRNPATMQPYLSTSSVVPPSRVLKLGHLNIPLLQGHTKLLRQGKPFWEYLAERDIPATVFKMPGNFPCENDAVDMVSGMGTPDLRGGYGSFTLYTTAPKQFGDDLTGGQVVTLSFSQGKAKTNLPGPNNSLKEGNPQVFLPLTIWRDRKNHVARVKLQDYDLLLKEGEWSQWMRISFPMLGKMVDVKGILKVYVKRTHPDFCMYVSPINIDPSDPSLPVVSSKQYGQELVENTGFFNTKGLPDDTKALSEGVLSDSEYLELAHQILDERGRLLDYHLDRFNRQGSGMLFFYVSSLDQNTHMFWRVADEKHALYSVELKKQFGNILKEFYAKADMMLGKAMAQCDLNDPDVALFLMSDHGFAPFRRQVNLNRWLYEAGFLALNNAHDMQESNVLANTNWSRTGAYSLGINCIYLNLRNRESTGIVLASQAERLRKSLRNELLRLKDPETGERAVSRVTIIPEAEHRRNPHAPDIIVGWNRGYRNSWHSILGGLSNEVFTDNLDKWSGDHCIDPNQVPAALASNRKISKQDPSLCDITATILKEFRISPNNDFEGQPLYNI
jgi:predicted AlkP superfamily phosphohydrolase/phosphomutase